MKQIIETDKAPAAIGTYSQAVAVSNVEKTVYISGQIPIDPANGTIPTDFEGQAKQVFNNLKAVTEAAGGSLADVVKFNVYLTSLGDFATLNEVMATYVSEPYPARAAVEVSALPKGVLVEIEAVMVLSS